MKANETKAARLLAPGGNSQYLAPHLRAKPESYNASADKMEDVSPADALLDLEIIIAHKPGDPGPAYNIIERTNRVIKTMEARRRW